VKLLLLGAGESGKSTVFKQMRVLYGDGFGEGDRKALTHVVHANLIAAAQTLVRGVEELGLRLDDTAIAPEAAADAGAGGDAAEGGASSSSSSSSCGADPQPVSAAAAAERIKKLSASVTVTPQIAVWVKTLWADPSVQEAYKQR
jgi:hypothetical protein